MLVRAGKVPFGNCPACKDNACGGRPNMKTPGPCDCPRPCHAWAAATTDPAVITGPAWAPLWKHAAAVAYHPGGIGLTVVDLDHAAAVAWARRTLPATRTVPTTRGEHWIYLGAMPSANAVRDGVDIKSTMVYARWLRPRHRHHDHPARRRTRPDRLEAVAGTARHRDRADGRRGVPSPHPGLWSAASPWLRSASPRRRAPCT
ncbi:hypothetical protein SMICM304S_05034 [Streptomyces microflavus]